MKICMSGKSTRADGIDVHDRVEADAAQVLRRVVAQPPGHPGVRGLVDGEAEEEDDVRGQAESDVLGCEIGQTASGRTPDGSTAVRGAPALRLSRLGVRQRVIGRSAPRRAAARPLPASTRSQPCWTG